MAGTDRSCPNAEPDSGVFRYLNISILFYLDKYEKTGHSCAAGVAGNAEIGTCRIQTFAPTLCPEGYNVKRIRILALALALLSIVLASVGAQSATFDASKFPKWVESDEIGRAHV